jgi:hypothetical protein
MSILGIVGQSTSEIAKLPEPFFNNPPFVLIEDSSLVAQYFVHRKRKERFQITKPALDSDA